MKTSAKMAIMSHLSDAQHLINSYPADANLLINYSKMILIKYGNDINQEVEDTELDALYVECKMRFGKC